MPLENAGPVLPELLVSQEKSENQDFYAKPPSFLNVGHWF